MAGRATRRLLLTFCLFIGLLVLYNARYRSEEVYDDEFDEGYTNSGKLSVSNAPQYPPSIQKKPGSRSKHRKIGNGLVETVSNGALIVCRPLSSIFSQI